MPEVKELYALFGSFINLPFPMPNGYEMKILDDNEIYLGAQLECELGTGRLYGVAAGMDFLLACEYGRGVTEPQIVIFKRR